MNKIKDRREQWFYIYKDWLERQATRLAKEGEAFTCPCCGYPTLSERGGYEICRLCNWEDDGQDDDRADEVWGGPNSNYSLTEARHNFAQHLTMYRPGDEQAYQRGVKKEARKRELITIYDQIFQAQGSFSFWGEYEGLKTKAETLLAEL